MDVNRRDFMIGSASFAALGAFADPKRAADEGYDAQQGEIDAVRKADYHRYEREFDKFDLRRFPALSRLECAFDNVLDEVRLTRVADRPAVWFLYNMGIVVKTREACFSVDLRHRRACELAPLLDFALITHNHDDHYTGEFYHAMDGAGKTVISNFADNYGARDFGREGGYARAEKTFDLRGVRIRTAVADHNRYLAGFTSTFEISTCGLAIYHTGDSCNLDQLNPSERPDLWIVHPRCGIDAASGYAKFKPKKTVIAHLNELGHDVNRWRWSWADGLEDKRRVEDAGGAAVVPRWGERLV